jgi:hypothetical protein
VPEESSDGLRWVACELETTKISPPTTEKLIESTIGEGKKVLHAPKEQHIEFLSQRSVNWSDCEVKNFATS